MIIPTHYDAARAAALRRAGLWTDVLIDSHIRRQAGVTPNAPAVIEADRTLTYAELDDMISRVATALRNRGVTAGDVVAWQLPNWSESIVIHHAALRIGAVSNPIVPIYREREVSFILEQGGAKIILVPEAFRGFHYLDMLESMQAALPALEAVVVVRVSSDVAAARYDRFEDLVQSDPLPDGIGPHRSADDVSLLLYTSGTTADPKGVLHTHNTLEYENRSIIELYGLTSADVVFMPSPLTHITGILYGLQMPFMLGAPVVLQDVWDPAAAFELMIEHRASFMIAATPFLHGLVEVAGTRRTGLPDFRYFGCGGADVPPTLIEQGQAILAATCLRMYGSSEFPTLCAANSSDSLEKRSRTDGRIYGAGQGRVVDHDGSDLGRGRVGELLVSGPELFLGYLEPSLNVESFTDDGWFRTGDLATIDADGYVEIVGRKKDIIVRGGEKISAKEIEDILITHPGVAEVAVVGMPDPVLVERVCAFVVTAASVHLELADLISFLRGFRIATQKLPERLELVAALPRTASGKIQKVKLRAFFR
jgi:cyclohexanecarboxylate-CoA ligase